MYFVNVIYKTLSHLVRNNGGIARRGTWVLTAFFICPLTLYGQLSGKGGVEGTVADSTGAVIANAQVLVTNVATNAIQNAKTTGTGDYHLSLDVGDYVIKVSAPGFTTAVQQNVRIDALATVALNVTLQAGSEATTVTVTDAPPQLQTSNATLGITMQQEMYSALPVLQDTTQRRATDFAALMPGVTASETSGNVGTNSGVVNGAGNLGGVSAIYINGVPITSVAGEGDPRFIWTSMPIDSIDQFQVQTMGYSAIYEGQGVQNYTIKSGGNVLHGVLFEYFRNTALDTWGFTAPAAINPLTGKATKPAEHQNEFGLFLGGPIIKNKLFLFGGYDGYRYAKGPIYQYQTNPTAAMLAGDFSSSGYNIFDPTTATCTGNTCSRTQFSDQGRLNVIPKSRLSPAALYLQKFLPPLTNSNSTNNYLGGYNTGLSNWSTANRLDYNLSSRHQLSLVGAYGRQATTAPGAVTISSTTNGAPQPYISTQQYAVKTHVFIFEDTYTISSRIVNQLKYGWGRYDGYSFNEDISPVWAASAAGIEGLPTGQASDSFPAVSFSGNSSTNPWAGYSSNRKVEQGYVLLDNVQWLIGKHSVTFGGQIAWLQYNFTANQTGVNPLQLAFNASETQSFSSGTTLNTATGQPYASFLLGATHAATFNLTSVPETGARFRPISPYIQDDWKVTPKLTLNIGLRWDYFPPYHEVEDRVSWMDSTKTNPLVGIPGAVVFGGNVQNGCNCKTNVQNYFKNIGPRLAFAYASDPNTVWRGSFSVVYTHGDAVGGNSISNQGSGLLGYSVSPATTNITVPTVGSTGSTYWSIDTPYPAYKLPPNFDPSIGTYYTTASTNPSQSVTYADPYYGGRAPQFINYSLGFQHQFTKDLTMTMSYVGSEGHFQYLANFSARGIPSNQLNPKYLGLGSQLTNSATPANLAAAGVNAPFATFSPSTGTVAQALKPFPQYATVTDPYGFVGNLNYNALQVYVQQRISHGLTFMSNYTWSRNIDNSGTFRSGYDIPAAYATDGKFHVARSLDRSLSVANQPQHFVATAVYQLPFGKGKFGGDNRFVRGALGGFTVSGIFQAYAGSPLAVVMSSCNVNPSQVAAGCVPMANPSFTGQLMNNGKYGNGVTAATLSSKKFINPDAFVAPPAYMFSTMARTAPLGLTGPGNYDFDLSLRRVVSLTERVKLNLQADMFNVTNHTRFGFTSQTLNWLPSSSTTSSFGTVAVINESRDIQLAARFEF
jgi:Carboxypeptidase regulatory-like domain/TonB-dependent Receptor Plug Domain